MNEKRSQLPWMAFFNGPHDNRIIAEDKYRLGKQNVCKCNLALGVERFQANAAFIVRCCNCHDELVGALKSVIQDMNIPGPPVNLTMDTCLKIDAAIAKATA